MSAAPFAIVMANTSAAAPAVGGLSPDSMAGVLHLVARGSDPMWEPNNHTGPHTQHYTGQNLVWSLELDIQRGVVSHNVLPYQTTNSIYPNLRLLFQVARGLWPACRARPPPVAGGGGAHTIRTSSPGSRQRAACLIYADTFCAVTVTIPAIQRDALIVLGNVGGDGVLKAVVFACGVATVWRWRDGGWLIPPARTLDTEWRVWRGLDNRRTGALHACRRHEFRYPTSTVERAAQLPRKWSAVYDTRFWQHFSVYDPTTGQRRT